MGSHLTKQTTQVNVSLEKETLKGSSMSNKCIVMLKTSRSVWRRKQTEPKTHSWRTLSSYPGGLN